MPREQSPAEILLRISLVEGFTARHLAWLAAHRDRAPASTDDAPPPRWSLLPKGRAAGKEFARGLSADLAFEGIIVVSGMARGIDAAAHEGALAGGGRTIAVLGCGVDVLYPPEAGRLRDNILGKGAIVSEFPPGTKPLPRRFPARNRLISGMAKAVVVAEAPAKSGALITATFALAQGTEAKAVPA